MKSIWFAQRHKFQELAVAHGLPREGTSGTLAKALEFAEMLTLAPSEESAARLLLEHREDALSFLEILPGLTDAMSTAEETPSTSELHGPFHELADFVVEFLREVRQIAPEKFD